MGGTNEARGLINQLQEVRVHMKTMASHWRGFGVVKEGI